MAGVLLQPAGEAQSLQESTGPPSGLGAVPGLLPWQIANRRIRGSRCGNGRDAGKRGQCFTEFFGLLKASQWFC
ncbi:MAG TPA: hypothetical protein VFK31_06690 [Rhodanobacteraceae bacterium]|nr:hypothetical protein [Rhodanobacteraceae bacterium]